MTNCIQKKWRGTTKNFFLVNVCSRTFKFVLVPPFPGATFFETQCTNVTQLTCAQFLHESRGPLRNRFTMSTHALQMSPDRRSLYVVPKHGANNDSKRALLVNRELDVFVPHIQQPVALWYCSFRSSPISSLQSQTVRDNSNLVALIRVHNSYQLETKSNSNPNHATKQHQIVVSV